MLQWEIVTLLVPAVPDYGSLSRGREMISLTSWLRCHLNCQVRRSKLVFWYLTWLSPVSYFPMLQDRKDGEKWKVNDGSSTSSKRQHFTLSLVSDLRSGTVLSPILIQSSESRLYSYSCCEMCNIGTNCCGALCQEMWEELMWSRGFGLICIDVSWFRSLRRTRMTVKWHWD